MCVLRASLETCFVIAGGAVAKTKEASYPFASLWRRLLALLLEIILNPSYVALVNTYYLLYNLVICYLYHFSTLTGFDSMHLFPTYSGWENGLKSVTMTVKRPIGLQQTLRSVIWDDSYFFSVLFSALWLYWMSWCMYGEVAISHVVHAGMS